MHQNSRLLWRIALATATVGLTIKYRLTDLLHFKSVKY